MSQLALSFAAPKLKPSALRVLMALRSDGGTGTAWDVMRRLGPHAQRNCTSKRLSELAELGLVAATGSRQGPLGKPETVFALTTAGSRVAIEAETTP